jgi:hypothetical protein
MSDERTPHPTQMALSTPTIEAGLDSLMAMLPNYTVTTQLVTPGSGYSTVLSALETPEEVEDYIVLRLQDGFAVT